MTGLLTWLTIFNLEPDQVPHFVLSDADKRQWMVRLLVWSRYHCFHSQETAGDVQWPTSNRVLQFLPGYPVSISETYVAINISLQVSSNQIGDIESHEEARSSNSC